MPENARCSLAGRRTSPPPSAKPKLTGCLLDCRRELTFLAGSFNISGVGLDRSRPAFKAFRPSTALRPSVGSRGFLAKCLFPQVQHPAAALEQSMPAKIFSILSPGNRTTAGKPIPTPIRATIVLAVGIGIGMLRPACAEEIRLLSAASMQTVLAEIVGDFERNS